MQKPLTFFIKNISIYAIFNNQSFNNMFTNDIVSFEQLGPISYSEMKTTLSSQFWEQEEITNPTSDITVTVSFYHTYTTFIKTV